MKTLRLISVLLAASIITVAVHAQLVQINYEGTYRFTPVAGPNPGQPVGDPIPFLATAIFDSATPGVKYDGYTFFDTVSWSIDHSNRPNLLRWQVLTYDLELPLTEIYLWDNGRLDVVFSSRFPFIDLKLNLTQVANTEHLPLPPFSLSADGSPLGQVEGSRILFGNEFAGPITGVSVKLIPIPEPVTYAGGAVGLLALLTIRRRRRQWLSSTFTLVAIYR